MRSRSRTALKVVMDQLEIGQLVLPLLLPYSSSPPVVLLSTVIVVFMKSGLLCVESIMPGCTGMTGKPNPSVIFLAAKLRRVH